MGLGLKVGVRLELPAGTLRVCLDEINRHASKTAVADHPLPAGAGTIYLTTVPDLTFDQAVSRARTRWQIEGRFKRWKSHASLGHSRAASQSKAMPN